MRRKTGFTLIELMIVVAIFGILAMMAGTNLQLWVNKSNATGFFRETFMQASLAKSRATSSRLQHVLRVDFSAGTVTIMQGNASVGEPVTAPNGCRIDSVVKTKYGVDNVVTVADGPTVDLPFNPSGDGFPFDDFRIRMSGPNGRPEAQVRIYGWTSKAGLDNAWS